MRMTIKCLACGAVKVVEVDDRYGLIGIDEPELREIMWKAKWPYIYAHNALCPLCPECMHIFGTLKTEPEFIETLR